MQAADLHINKELFIQLAQGNEHAFRQIFHYYTARLHLFVFSIVKSQAVAEEIVQDVFLKLWANRQSVAAKDNPSSWLFTVAANTSYTHLKKLSYEKKFVDLMKNSMNSYALSNPIEDIVLTREGESILQEAVEALPRQRKLIFHLSRTKGLSRQEIADQLHISSNTVKNQLSSAVKSIREYLKKAGIFLFSLVLLLISR